MKCISANKIQIGKRVFETYNAYEVIVSINKHSQYSPNGKLCTIETKYYSFGRDRGVYYIYPLDVIINEKTHSFTLGDYIKLVE
jgi:hypothetical protein